MNRQQKLINFDDLKSFWGDDSKIQREMLEIYITDIPEYLSKLKIAVSRKDLRDIYHYAHCIKGASLATAINKIPEQCTQIENLAQKAQLEGLEPLLNSLEHLFTEVKKFILSYLNYSNPQ